MANDIAKYITNQSRQPRSAIRAVVFDWAGTVIDFGSLAPMGAFVKLFQRYGVEITVAEARVPMGLAKWDHIKALGTQPRVAAAWRQSRGHDFTDDDVDELYAVFTPMNAQSVVQHATLIPGVVRAVTALRERGIAIGSTTGYNRAIMEVVAPLAAEQGFAPDNLVCAGDLIAGRPSPLMMYRTFADLGVWPPSAVVKVDDTVPGIEEGLAAGTWVVGVVVSGNGVGLTQQDWLRLDAAKQTFIRERAAATLLAAGAHIVIDTVDDLLPVLAQIEAHITSGAVPQKLAQTSTVNV